MADRVEFSVLERLRKTLAGIRRNHVPTMAHYISDKENGFWHQAEKRWKASLSSTATCVSSLVNANLWHDVSLREGKVAATLIRKRTSADLPKDNAFSLSFVIEGVLDLQRANPDYRGAVHHHQKIIENIAPKLVRHLMSRETKLAQVGSISEGPYPPSAYLTQLVFRVLDRCKMASASLRKVVHAWARSDINKQVSLITAASRVGDPLELAYALILAVSTTPDEKASPEDKEIFAHALAVFFSAQGDDGSWPSSNPLFHYPEVGNAYCFDYELLVQLLSCKELWDDLLKYIPAFDRATNRLAKTAFDLDPDQPGKVIGWASGHHPQLGGPESWSTASVYHFAHVLDRFVAEAIRRSLFFELNSIYMPPSSPKTSERGKKRFAEGFLDADLLYQGRKLSLRETLFDHFVAPIEAEVSNVANGGKLGRNTPMSAILFGPPGTSKNSARRNHKSLSWLASRDDRPLLPSFKRNGSNTGNG